MADDRPLDDTDRTLLAELSVDGRASMRGLAQRLHISRANAYARVERLLRDQVIRGFAARIDPERAGLRTSAYVTCSIEQNAWREVSARLREIRYVEHVALVGADVDVVALVRTPDTAAGRPRADPGDPRRREHPDLAHLRRGRRARRAVGGDGDARAARRRPGRAGMNQLTESGFAGRWPVDFA